MRNTLVLRIQTCRSLVTALPSPPAGLYRSVDSDTCPPHQFPPNFSRFCSHVSTRHGKKRSKPQTKKQNNPKWLPNGDVSSRPCVRSTWPSRHACLRFAAKAGPYGSTPAQAHPSCDSPNTSRRVALGAMSAWSVKTRRVSSRHCRNTRVYGHTLSLIHI